MRDKKIRSKLGEETNELLNFKGLKIYLIC